MADEHDYDVDLNDDDDDDDEDDEDEHEQSDDDTAFFPIDEPIVHASQSSQITTATTTSHASKQSRTTSDLSVNKYSTGLSASNNCPQDNNFEYVGQYRRRMKHRRTCSFV